jgi:hypothetical protein
MNKTEATRFQIAKKSLLAAKQKYIEFIFFKNIKIFF